MGCVSGMIARWSAAGIRTCFFFLALEHGSEFTTTVPFGSLATTIVQAFLLWLTVDLQVVAG